MKKIFLSLFVIITFLAYSIHQQSEAKEALTGVTNSHQVLPPHDPVVMIGQRGLYRDGTYLGSVEDVFYGNIQVQAIISGGRITDVIFLQHPSDRRTSIQINEVMMPILKSEAIQAQSAEVDIVSGATESSVGFKASLAKALAEAK